jgi:arylsulfatase A-like enzyme
MKIISAILRSILVTALVLVLSAAAFIGYRYQNFGQQDDAARIASKREYLRNIAASPIDLDTAPNIIFILFDDMGYGDIGAGDKGGNSLNTPNIDSLASGGVTLSDFHSPAPVCTPSRAGFLTGRLAPRAGLPNVVFPSGSAKEFFASILLAPGANVRIPAEEITMADVLGAAGYRTGMVGKWHMGDQGPSLPNDMGFDDYFGALYSNDMEPFALYRNRKIETPHPLDQRYLSGNYRDAALEFIGGGEGPFFLYFAHNFPHDPLYSRDERRGRSDAGLYGDVLEEIDQHIGEIVAELKTAGQLENTLIMISSDNGPWFLGNAGDLRGRKGNTFEGGMRVPFIAHWPGKIAADSTVNTMAMGIDLMPTVLDILGLPKPTDRVLDGTSILALLSGGAPAPSRYLHYYDGETLFAVRDQRFKYRGPAGVFYATDQMSVGGAMPQKEWLFDLQADPGESYDVSERYPEKLLELREEFARKQNEMAANLRGWTSLTW